MSNVIQLIKTIPKENKCIAPQLFGLDKLGFQGGAEALPNEESAFASYDSAEWADPDYIFDTINGFWRRSAICPFLYSDGDEVEERIAAIVRSAVDRTSDSLELHKSISDWPTNYHLSPLRANLLRPLRHLLKGRILEIGAGAGAITRYLGECGAQVVAIEGSARRAAIAASRCANLANVRVVADDFAEFPAGAKFDVVTLIGVLEYARLFFKVGVGDPVDALLARARSFLRPGGILIVAIENQLGLKYFAGCAEDHFGKAMIGVEDRYGDDTAVTFGRAELARRLAASALPQQQWWFPLPDYKLPISFFSDRALQHDVDLSALLSEAVRKDPQLPNTLSFSLEKAWRPVFRNGLAADLANSFLVACSDAALPEHDVLAVHYGDVRRPQFKKEVRFEWGGDGVTVRRSRLRPAEPQSQTDVISLHLKDEEFLGGRTWHAELVSLFSEEGWTLEQWLGWARVWFDAFLKESAISSDPMPKHTHAIPGDLVDAIPCNLIFNLENDPVFFDQEWRLEEPAELGYIVYRAIFVSLLAFAACARPANGVKTNRLILFRHFVHTLGWEISADDLRRYAELEARI